MNNAQVVAVAAWLAGVVLAKGWVSTLVAFFIPLWAWYLLAEFVIGKFL